MKTDPREILVSRIFAEQEKFHASTTPHPDDDTLGLFAEGRISEPQLGEVVRHLADCGEG